jgi:hypothetical protein
MQAYRAKLRVMSLDVTIFASAGKGIESDAERACAEENNG